MTKFGMGQSVPRSEDPRLLTGRGRYTDDINRPDQAYATFVRSPYASAAIRSIDLEAARQAPGVLAVYVIDDLDAEGIGPIPCRVSVTNRDGSTSHAPERPALARGRVRHVGDPVAAIIATSPEAGRDAAELVEIDYDAGSAVVVTEKALDPAAPKVWEELPDNQCFDWGLGDEASTDAAFAQAAHVVELSLVNNRVVVNSMEGRACIADYDRTAERFTFIVGSQGVFSMRAQLAKSIFKLPEDRFHVLTADVGGAFGMKIFMYPEYVVALFAARRLGRPVKWTSERSEAFLTDSQGRDHVTTARLALDADGRMLGLKVDTVANLGAYLSNFGPFVASSAGAKMLTGLYAIPAAYARYRGVFTHTTPVDAYRGAGRPEAAYVIERLVDVAARRLGLEAAELRRRNFMPSDSMPCTTALGVIYDSGEFARNLDDALALADAAGFAARKAASARRGKLRGLGLSTYVEACAGGMPEEAKLVVERSGAITLYIGTQNNGQGHETAYQQLIAERLGVAMDSIAVVQGDSDRIASGGGTGGSRSVPVGGVAVAEAADLIREKAQGLAADMLEAAAADIVLEEGRFAIVGTDRSVSFTEIVAAMPGEDAIAFDETGGFKPNAPTLPNGAHLCEVEVDPDTGEVAILRYSVVDDLGRVLNPLLAAGQIHGGVVQGVGQALYEHTVYDEDSGQLLSGSFMDYALPRAEDIPSFDIRFNEVPCKTNPLGMKGAGEAGTIGATPAVINAIVDALATFGVEHVDMPATPLKVWHLCQQHHALAAAE